MASETINNKLKNRYTKKGKQTGYWEEEGLIFIMDIDDEENEGETVVGKGHYVNGKKKGIWRYYSESGVLKIESNFKNDICYGISNVYDLDGKLIEKILEIN